jgi:thiosulfate/3-mercaptopyruvate sulfurtransferase
LRVKSISVPYTTLISTGDLAEQLEAGWLMADCRYDLQHSEWGHQEYLRAHIPGAIHVSLSHDLSAAPSGANGRHPLPAEEVMAATFGRLGIEAGMQVVAYDQDCGMFASRLWWMLRYAGHSNVAVLNGGWAKWVAEKRPTRSGDESRAAVTFTPAWNSGWHVDLGNVEATYRDASTVLVDARAPERFEGRIEPLDRVPGHIPGAVNHPYRNNLAADDTMLPADALREQFRHNLEGHTPAQTVMYCGSGVSACHNLLAMEYAGLAGARLYVGSWSEWSADPARPVETGPGRSRSGWPSTPLRSPRPTVEG